MHECRTVVQAVLQFVGIEAIHELRNDSPLCDGRPDCRRVNLAEVIFR